MEGWASKNVYLTQNAKSKLRSYRLISPARGEAISMLVMSRSHLSFLLSILYMQMSQSRDRIHLSIL
uniref:Uncharacterized protein n=1 Tax=Picea glauca TaxID=3330 RepID=A0A101LYJ9_PICGL|nr:hypothetical protein ABT39_MTgene5936 [Picea glauca]